MSGWTSPRISPSWRIGSTSTYWGRNWEPDAQARVLIYSKKDPCLRCGLPGRRMTDILAYHIVWTMYGTWLPGDWRGWVRKRIWGILPPDPDIERQARERMAEPMVLLTDEQRAIVERTIADHCRIGGWTLHA